MAQAGRHAVADGGLSTMEIVLATRGRMRRVAAEALPAEPVDWWAQMAVATLAAGAIVATLGTALVVGVEMLVGVR